MVIVTKKALTDPSGLIWQWARNISALVIIPVLIPVFLWVMNLERRISHVELTTVTKSDEVEIYKAIATKANKDDVPPPEVLMTIELFKTHLAWHMEQSRNR